MRIAGIDPGVNGCGASVFVAGELVLAAYLRTRAEVLDFLRKNLMKDDRLIIEFPRVYRAAQQKGDQNDLLQLARAVGRVEEAALEACGLTPELVAPRDWKGTLNGDDMVERIKGRLHAYERVRVKLPSAASLAHNVYDGVGIGLWAVGRLEPKRVIER